MRAKFFVLAAALVLVVQVSAFAFSVPWGTSSWDDSTKDGKDYLNLYYPSIDPDKYVGWDGNNDPYYWSGADYSFTIEHEIAGNKDTNLLKYFLQGDTGNLFDIFASGTANGPVAKTIGSQFGLSLIDTKANPDNFYYTDRQYNTNQLPQALIYVLGTDEYGPSEWLVAWEDLNASTLACGGTDNDYNDMYLRLERTSKPVPEPISTTLFLLGGGAMGLRIFRRKKA